MGSHLLFHPDRPALADALKLLELTHDFLYGDTTILQYYRHVEVESVGYLRARIQGGELPVITLEVLTALLLTQRPKDYNAYPCWNAALALADSLPGPHPRVTDQQANHRAPELAAFVSWMGGVIRRVRQGKSLDPREEEIVRLTLTLGPFGLCAQSAHPFVHAYPAVRAAATDDPHWKALEDVMQVIMGNDDALRTLRPLVEANSRSPSLLWFDEMISRLDGHEIRADRLAAQIEARLGEGDLGANASQLCASMREMGRNFVNRQGNPAAAIWPFRSRRQSSDACEMLDEAAHYFTMNFRMIRAIELLAPAAQQLARQLSPGSD